MQVVLAAKENSLTRSKAIAVIWDRIFALQRFIIRGLPNILISSLRVLFALSEAERIFLVSL